MLAGTVLLPLARPALAAAEHSPELVDAHIHFFTNDLARYPVDLRNARETEKAMRARFLHAPVTFARMLPIWDRLGIGGGIGVQYSGAAFKTDDSYVLDVADANPKRIRTEIILSLFDPESPTLPRGLARTHHVSAIRT